MWVLIEAAWAVKGQYFVRVLIEAALEVKGQYLVWIQWAALTVKGQHPCVGPWSYNSSRGSVPLRGSRRLHRQSSVSTLVWVQGVA